MAAVSLFKGVVDSPLLIPSIIFISLVSFVVQKYVVYRRLAQFRGPFWASFTELWVVRVTFQSRVHTAMRELSETYGSVARAGPNLLVTSDAELLRKMATPRSKYGRSEWNQALKLDPRCDNTISEMDEKKHAELRYMLSHGYSGKDIPNRESRVDDRVMDYINLIDSKYLSTPGDFKIMDLARVSQYFTLDVITDMAFGYPFGFLAANTDLYEYIESMGPLMPLLELQSNVTWIAAILNEPHIKKLMAPTANDGSGLGQMIGASQKAVKERYKAGAEQKEDMLSSFMNRGVTQLQAESESLLQVLAGADSTATAIRMVMYFIMTNPLVYNKLRAELDGAKLSWPVNTDAEAKTLPYLQAVIKEGLRAWPPGAGISTKVVPPEGETLDDGRFIPGGTRIGWSAWGTHHSKEVYGEDSHYFRPERWLEADEENLVKMERVQDGMFGNGRYGCLGKSLAMLELNKIIATFMRRYDMSLIDPTASFKSKCNGFFAQSGINVRVMKRDDASKP